MPIEEIHDLLAYDGLKIVQRKDLFRFSLDSLLLGDFVRINPRAKRIVDFGTGLAPIPLYLSLKTTKPITGIDIQDEALQLAKKSILLNDKSSQIDVIKMDILEANKYFDPSSIDIVTVNPPFFKYHNREYLNDLDSMTISRHEVLIDLQGVIQSAKKIITNGGNMFLIHRASRLEEIILLLHENNFATKRIRFVYTKTHGEAMMVLVESKYNGKTGNIRIEEPLTIYDETGNYTKEVLKIFHLGDESHDS